MSRPGRDRMQQVIDAFTADGAAVVFNLNGSTGVRDWDGGNYQKAAVQAGTTRWVGTHVGSDEHGGAFWDDCGVLRYRNNNEAVGTLWWSFNHRHPGTAALLVQAFQEHGFNAEWSGDPADCVTVTLGGGR